MMRLRSLGLLLGFVIGGCQQPTSPGTELGQRRPTAAIAGIAAVPPLFSDVLLVSGLSNPTLMAFAPDGRLFVSEQAGAVRVIKNGVLLPTPFVRLAVDASGERGVLGIAFDPAFVTNQRVYIYYTSNVGPHNRVSRFTASGDVASGGETPLLDLPTLSGATNHNGGALHFAPDGTLFVAVGENANGANSQSMNTTLGKMLRINPDGTIPPTNPFFGSTTGINRSIWALGLRNPFTFAFQQGTGRLFINDVGQSSWEEVNDGVAGANYGWPATEGNTADPRFRSPFYTYDHSAGCAITGGDFYNPTNPTFPANYRGDYFFADFCSGWIRAIDLTTKVVTNFATGISNPTDILVGDDGSLYYLERGTGSIRRVSYAPSSGPVITQQPASQSVVVGANVSFTVGASGAAPLSYQWQRNQSDIPGATAASYLLTNAQLADSGARFRAIVSNGSGTATSVDAVLTVTQNRAPVAAVTAPAARTLFQGGQTINYAGTGTDPEDGTLPASAFTWEARLWHNDGNLHSHPFYGPVTGAKSGSLTIPTQGETSANIWYRIYLTVHDSRGVSTRDSVDILPRTAPITIATNPAGLQVTLDGVPGNAPVNFTGVVGIQRTLGLVSPQTLNGQTWQFVSWSDGGAAQHAIATPATATTYTATFAPVASAIYEAEAATGVGTRVGTELRGFTGTGYLSVAPPFTGYVEWKVTVPAAGPRDLDFRYAFAGSSARTMRIDVNGSTVNAALPFGPTGKPPTWQLATLRVQLTAGVNTIRASATGARAPVLDHLVVR